MNKYVILLRGINVGGKNKISMAELKSCLKKQCFEHVNTYIQSGNILLQSALDARTIGPEIEKLLSQKFKLDSPLIKVLVLSDSKLKAVIDEKPEGFGEYPKKYHSDVIFLMGIDSSQAIALFNPREGVDRVWPSNGVIYSQRLSALRTKSRLSKVTGTPEYKSMTIRNWNTALKLLVLLQTD